MLIHTGGRDYELRTLLDGRWFLHADIRAITEDDALLQANKMFTAANRPPAQQSA
jgi:hypothetical protein